MTKLDRIASGGRVPVVVKDCTSLEVNLNIDCKCSGQCCVKFEGKIADFKFNLGLLTFSEFKGLLTLLTLCEFKVRLLTLCEFNLV